jgi:hypothetical protein
MAIGQNITANNLPASIQSYLTEGGQPAVPEGLKHALCPNCGHPNGTITKFCTGCGTDRASAQTQPPHQAPDFAQIHANQAHVIPHELQEEMGSLLVILARERFFLCFHWFLFLLLHIAGFVLAIHVYQCFIGDEFTRVLMALVPISFLNLAAFASLPPIKNTRISIARLKEQLIYLHYKIEYRNL